MIITIVTFHNKSLTYKGSFPIAFGGFSKVLSRVVKFLYTY